MQTPISLKRGIFRREFLYFVCWWGNILQIVGNRFMSRNQIPWMLSIPNFDHLAPTLKSNYWLQSVNSTLTMCISDLQGIEYSMIWFYQPRSQHTPQIIEVIMGKDIFKDTFPISWVPALSDRLVAAISFEEFINEDNLTILEYYVKNSRVQWFPWPSRDMGLALKTGNSFILTLILPYGG